ncbi:MAG: DUF4829 domain-containing protein [Oscillospiraceae bacterium]|jgi:hypothetical protein|nr:DUF4829 domain-containing protein [Oscillospiraceae bacterium]
MKKSKTAAVILCLVVMFSFSSCIPNPGQVNEADIVLGKSSKFTEKEVQEAANCVLEKFRDFEGCNLLRLWYDEDESNYEANYYYLTDEVGEDNIIVLFSDFYVSSTETGGGLEPNYEYTDWMWIIVRESENDDWEVRDWGY